MSSPGELLRRHGLRPKKEWGQNFLGDAGVLSNLARLARAGPGDWIVELGAGLGHFTRVLAATSTDMSDLLHTWLDPLLHTLR